MANEFQINIGEFHDCKTSEPDHDGIFVIVYGNDVMNHINVNCWSFVVGHGWNCSRRADGKVDDKFKIEITWPTYWAPIEIVKGPEVDDHE